ncbi:MAG TPA: hypothetical protein DF383_00825 [Deltaproteobacteria bacterium]|nr:hypothetical protein [Deltaproteobacteria bacterium]
MAVLPMLKINIKKEFREDYLSRAAGEKLRSKILEARQRGERVELDFSGVTIASVSFFDEGIAKLAEQGWTKKKFEESVHLKDLQARDKILLQEICENRGLV